jgi:hypothetical protein
VSLRIPPPNGPDHRSHQHITVGAFAGPGATMISAAAGLSGASNTRRLRRNRPHSAPAAASPANRVTDHPAGAAPTPGPIPAAVAAPAVR